MRFAALLTLLLLACGPASTPDAGDVGCAKRTGLDTYSAGLQHTSMSGNTIATLLNADPAPPARGTNTWMLKLTDAQGEALSGSPTATPFMPEHGHGTSVVPAMLKQVDGTYQAGPLYLFMPGLWRVTFAPDADAGAADSVPFFFCIDG